MIIHEAGSLNGNWRLPMSSVDRRTLLKLSLAGVGATVLLPGTAFADDDLPPVPGMLGDRRANEMWYQFDQVALYQAFQEVLTSDD
jgi:hypothetical protein